MSNKHKIALNVIIKINKLINAANPECNVSGPNSPQRINPDASPIFHMKYRNITKAVINNKIFNIIMTISASNIIYIINMLDKRKEPRLKS